ncbi:MAG: hypothetical protein NUV73_01585 [Candidatus Daviesbacteria bacterium]|nr:hypothetical protein [Candidatus Daviesbacteria bacterium]
MGLFNPHASNKSLFGKAIPDFGISEKVQSLVRPNTAYAPSGGSNLFGGAVLANNTSTGPVYGPTRPAGPTNPGGTRTSTPQPQQQPQQQASAGPQGPGTGDVDAIYNPINDFLIQMAQEYQAGQGEAETQIGTSFDRALTPIAEKEATEISGLNRQEGVVNTSEQNALAQARQLFNELSQRNISMFGQGTSAGPGAQELLSRQTAGQFGQIGQTATSGRTTIEEERTRVKTFTAQKKTELEQQKQEAIRNLQQEFRNGLLQINQAKAQNESAKAGARMDLLQRAQEQAYQIQQADQAYARAIDMFEREKAANLAQVGAYGSQQGIDQQALEGFNNVLSAAQQGRLTRSQVLVAGAQLGIPEKFIGTALDQLPKPADDELSAPRFAGEL